MEERDNIWFYDGPPIFDNLIMASHFGHSIIACHLLNQGATVDAIDESDIIRLLLYQGASIDTINKYGKTALFWATRTRHEAIIRLLLDRGAAIDAVDEYGKTALFGAARNRHEAIVRLRSTPAI